MKFAPGSVGETLTRMQGVWHDHIQLYQLNGDRLADDPWSGTPGPAPFENLVYIEFDGQHYRQSNITFRGRPLKTRSFAGILTDGILHFSPLGPGDPTHVGVAAGPGRIIFSALKVTDAWQNYAEPDFLQWLGPRQRTRTTILYRHGIAVRTLFATGKQLSSDPTQRVSCDPRGREGPVHDTLQPTLVFDK